MNPYLAIIDPLNAQATALGLWEERVAQIPLGWFFHQPLITEAYRLKNLWGDGSRPEIKQPLTHRLQRAWRHFSRPSPSKGALWLVGSSNNIRLRRADGSLGHYLYDGIRQMPDASSTIAEAQWLSGEANNDYRQVDSYLDIELQRNRFTKTAAIARLQGLLMNNLSLVRQWVTKGDQHLALQGKWLQAFESLAPTLTRQVATAYTALTPWCDRFEPKALATVCYYSVGNRALTDLCKTRKVPTFDLQHGIINPGHPGYHLGKISNPRQQPIPDRILCYGDFWRQLLLKIGPWSAAQLPLVGNLVAEQLQSHDATHRLKIRDAARTTLGLSRETKVLLVTTNLAMGEAILLFLQASGVLQLANWKVVVKQHPIYDIPISQARAILGADLPILKQELPLSELLLMSDAHLTVNSTTLFDALGAGLPNLIAKVGSWPVMQHVVDHGFAPLVTAAELTTALHHLASQGANLQTKAQLAALYAPQPCLESLRQALFSCKDSK